MMRPGIFAFVIFLSTLPMTAVSAEGIERHPIVLAELQEESIPAQDLAAPSPAAGSSPAAAPSPAVEESPDSDSSDSDQSEPDDWQRVPGGKPSAAAQTLPAQKGQPAANAQTPDDDETAPNPAQNEQPAQAAPPEIAPALDAGSIATTPQISDQSLAPLINSAPTPARAASLRITEQERIELDQGHTDDAIRELAHAISIDPSNSYAYFYLGRAYVARRDYGQAETFFKRAEIGLGANSAWLGEAYAFEGMSLEQDGKSAEAAVAYQKALAASPGNLTARVGVTRVGAVIPAAANGSAPAAPDLDQPAPAEPDPASAPDEAPVPPPPAAPAPPTD